MGNRKESLPSLTQVAVDILVALTGQELHGYAIMKEVEEDTGEKILTGTLYRTLAKLEEQGLIEEVDKSSEDDDERRKYYRVTGLGERALAAELRRMKQRVEIARRKDLLPQPGSIPAAS